ncbi:MAG: LamG-like jellyroll fold domain-containing protein, partial [Prevotella sp.]
MKKKLLLSLAALMALPAILLAATGDMDNYLPSNWGGWKNLTYGVTNAEYYSFKPLPMEVKVEGNIIHTMWMEWAKSDDGTYALYYRRSADLGDTWEPAQLIATNNGDWNGNGSVAGNNSKVMAVEGQNVYFAVPYWRKDNTEDYRLRLVRSTDGGKTFTTKDIMANGKGMNQYCYSYQYPHIAVEGQTVVVAVQETWYNDYFLRVLTSYDGGETFTDVLDKTTQTPQDLQVSGRHWAVMAFKSSGSSTDRWSNVYLFTSTNGITMEKQNIGYVSGDGKTYATIETLHGPSYAYHPQMVMQGDIIDVMFIGSLSDGSEGNPAPGYDFKHVIHRRSTDGGVTWGEPQYLPESTGEHGTIAAKGDNVYVLAARNGLHGIYHSHDGGKTWAWQERCVWDAGTNRRDWWNASSAYQLYIAPDDATGQHVYLTGQRALLVESKDGFRTVSRNFCMGNDAWNYNKSANYALTVQLDQKGREHWFMSFTPPYKPFDKYFWNIVYRRDEPVAATGSTNMALDMTEELGVEGDRAQHQVIIPMSESLHAIKEATTVECWIRVDSIHRFQVASLTHNSVSHSGSIYEGGWYIGVHNDGSGWHSFTAGICTELSQEGKGKDIWDRWRYQITDTGMWHHVAITYDSKEEKDNFRLYCDGVLLGTATEKGDILQGNDPIVIGRVGGGTNHGLVDNFAVWNRALSQEEIRQHIYNAPTGKEEGCRLLLTFDGSLKDQSDYHNDAIPLEYPKMVAYDGIRPPHPEFIAAKDVTGKKVSLTDMTQDGLRSLCDRCGFRTLEIWSSLE